MIFEAIIPATALWLDKQLGEPKRHHPLVFFGRVATKVEEFFYGDASQSNFARQVRGGIAVLFLLIPPVAVVCCLDSLPFFHFIFSVLFLYLCFGMQSLSEHAEAVRLPLAEGNLAAAQYSVGMMVSRETASMNEEQITSAAMESVLENGNDAVFATLFWFFVLGAPGAVLLRLSNTLDAMWGYRTDRYNHFGRFAARLDDVLNYIPARLTAITFALLGNTKNAFHCWKTQAPFCTSPNGGPVMTSGAASLGVVLGGPAVYHGVLHDKPLFGHGNKPVKNDISRAILFVKRGAWLWVLLYFIAKVIIHA